MKEVVTMWVLAAIIFYLMIDKPAENGMKPEVPAKRADNGEILLTSNANGLSLYCLTYLSCWSSAA